MSVRTRLILGSVISSGTALVIVGSVIASYELAQLRRGLVSRMSVQAEVVGTNSLSAILFNDSGSAGKTLSALEADTHVTGVALYGDDGQLFASYSRDSQESFEPVLADAAAGHDFQADRLLVRRAVMFDEKPVGTVLIVSDLLEISEARSRSVTVLVVLLLASLLVALVIWSWLQRDISKPLLDLAQTAQRVSQLKDFSTRVPGDRPDEIGELIHAFNEMLDEINIQQTELKSAHDELEQRVEQRTAQLKSANDEIEAFSYSVSHDLRAPLRSIDGFSQALLEDYQERLDDTGQDYLRRIRAGCQRMGMLIDDLLGLARLTRQEMRCETVDVSDLAAHVAEELKSRDSGRQVEFRIQSGLVAQADASLLRIALENLLGNASKFTRDRPDARIEVGSMPSDKEMVFYVKDNGAGFDMSYANKLFGAFQRLHSQKEFEGTGVGLATVQRIIRRHEGRVWAEGQLGQGASFYFTLQRDGRANEEKDHPTGGRQP